MNSFLSLILTCALIASALAAPHEHTPGDGHDHAETGAVVAHNHSHHHDGPGHNHTNDHFIGDGHSTHKPEDNLHPLDVHVKCHGEYAPATDCPSTVTVASVNASTVAPLPAVDYFWFDMDKQECNKYETGKCAPTASQNQFNSMDDCLKCIGANSINGSAAAVPTAAAPAAAASAAVSTPEPEPEPKAVPEPSSTAVPQ